MPSRAVSRYKDRHPRQLKGLLWKTSFAATTTVLIALFFIFRGCGSALLQSQGQAGLAVRRFHERLNAGQFQDICDEADPTGMQDSQRDELMGLLRSVHTTLGNAGMEKLINIRTDLATGGALLSADYETVFTRGNAVETFSWTREGSALKLYRYSIQSNVPLHKQ